MLKNKILQLLFIFLAFAMQLHAQSIFKNYTVNNGLLSNNTYGAIQDSKGFIWISSDRGVSRFDGTRFLNYDISDGLLDNQVINIFYDSKGRIWLNSLNGKFSYIFQNKIFSENNDPTLKNSFANTKAISSITEDDNGNIHFNILSGNFEFEYDGKNIIRKDILTDLTIKDKQVFFTINNNKKIYRVNASGVYGSNNYQYKLVNRLNKNDGAYINITAHNNGKVVYLDSTGVTQIIPNIKTEKLFTYPENLKTKNLKRIYYTTNNIWIVLNSGGIQRFTETNGVWINKGLLFDKIDINNVIEDNEGNFWLTTNYSGIFYLPKFYEEITSLNQINNNSISKCFSAKFYNNELWLGAEDYKMYKLINKRVSQSFTINKINLGGNKAYKLLINDKYVYAGFLNGICQINKTNVNEQKEVNVLVKGNTKTDIISGIPLKSFSFDKNGKLIISGGVRDLFESDNPILISNNRPCFTGGRSYYTYTDPLGNSFISTSKGVTKMQDTSYNFLNLNDTILKEKINTMLFIRYGMYLIGNGTGLHLIKNNKTVSSITDKKLLPGVNCKKSILKYGQIWVMCDIGIVQVVESNDKLSVVQKYNLGNGILNEPPVDFEIDSTSIYVVTGKDVIAINKQISNINPKSKTVITDFIVGGINKDFEETPIIIESDLPLKISFDILAYGISENKEFQYRLGKGLAWQSISSNTISLSELDNGKINFEVRGKIGNGEWGEITTFGFVYDKPFYKTRWVQLLTLFLSMLLLFLFWQRREKRKQKIQNENYELINRIASLKNQALQNLMHPHFVFNSLNSIQHYINDNDKENANKYLTRFAKLIRLNLNSGVNGFITIEDEIERLQLYLNLEALRFENEVSFSIKANKNVDGEELYLPSMILQPFVENALWHGILPSGKKGHIDIYFSTHNKENIKITIEDNGIGIENSKQQKTSTTHKSKGIGLINERVNLLQEKFKKQFTITASVPFPENKIQPGSLVTLIIPFLYEDEIK